MGSISVVASIEPILDLILKAEALQLAGFLHFMAENGFAGQALSLITEWRLTSKPGITGKDVKWVLYASGDARTVKKKCFLQNWDAPGASLSDCRLSLGIFRGDAPYYD